MVAYDHAAEANGLFLVVLKQGQGCSGGRGGQAFFPSLLNLAGRRVIQVVLQVKENAIVVMQDHFRCGV